MHSTASRSPFIQSTINNLTPSFGAANPSIIDSMLRELKKACTTIIGIILIGQHCFTGLCLACSLEERQAKRRWRKSESRCISLKFSCFANPKRVASESSFQRWTLRRWRNFVLIAHLNIIHATPRTIKRSFRNYEITFNAQVNLASHSRRTIGARYFVNLILHFNLTH